MDQVALSVANRELITMVTRGDAEAAAFLEMMVEVLHFWDDLVDRDQVVTDQLINARMWQALVLLPRNLFYRAHFADLNPILAVAIQNWICANSMEQDGFAPDDLPIAFIIRSSYVDLIVQVALIVGGYPWAAEVTPMVRRHAHRETYPGYITNLELQNQKASQHVL